MMESVECGACEKDVGVLLASGSGEQVNIATLLLGQSRRTSNLARLAPSCQCCNPRFLNPKRLP